MIFNLQLFILTDYLFVQKTVPQLNLALDLFYVFCLHVFKQGIAKVHEIHVVAKRIQVTFYGSNLPYFIFQVSFDEGVWYCQIRICQLMQVPFCCIQNREYITACDKKYMHEQFPWLVIVITSWSKLISFRQTNLSDFILNVLRANFFMHSICWVTWIWTLKRRHHILGLLHHLPSSLLFLGAAINWTKPSVEPLHIGFKP